MKRTNILWAAACAMLFTVTGARAVSPAPDTAADSLRVRELNLRKAELQQQIKAEDAKRNRTISGVAPETQELLNDRQDSICLELRSQLVAVELELRERVPDQTASALAIQLGRIAQQSAQHE